jgi:hypothetical protein
VQVKNCLHRLRSDASLATRKIGDEGTNSRAGDGDMGEWRNSSAVLNLCTRCGRPTRGERALDADRTGGWMDPRAGLELRPLCREDNVASDPKVTGLSSV